MINITNITIKNFLSIGNVTQSIGFENEELTLVLGNNLDLGGEGSKNGAGKSSFMNALCFGLYGSAITNIKKDNLINKTNGKEMFVSVEFEKNGTKYRIERGRRPGVLRFYVNSQKLEIDETDEGQGENKETQAAIEQVLGMGHTMFKHLVALNTFTEPFLSLRAHEQREMIERLLGITLLSEKAAVLRDLTRDTKDAIKEEEYKIKALEEANTRIEKSIRDLERRQKIWGEKKSNDLNSLVEQLVDLEVLDINAELENHKLLAEFKEQQTNIKTLTAEIDNKSKQVKNLENRKEKYSKELESLENNKCYACNQDVHDHNHTEMINDRKNEISKIESDLTETADALAELNNALKGIGDAILEPSTYYNDISHIYEHKNKLSQLEKNIEVKEAETDPYQEQIISLRQTGIRPIKWDKINELTKLKEHQDFLLKLLTNKDSFIRKKIIEQNLSYLNGRLQHYLSKMGLPHQVKFQSDLSVEITELGREMDFDNLSRGERNRLILGLSWSFRDVFESMNHPINVMFIDELIDSGLDSSGVEAALEVLKGMARERSKAIFLISHREELIGRVNSILNVVKENGFTGFSYGDPE